MIEATIEQRRYKLAYPMQNQEMVDWIRDQFDIDPGMCSKIILTIDAQFCITAELHMYAHKDVFLQMPELERTDG